MVQRDEVGLRVDHLSRQVDHLILLW